ncbi:MAG: AAA family ATPase [Acidithiobacillus sp.]|nr:AAA family ATPase [Acidithiobacillus sp.]
MSAHNIAPDFGFGPKSPEERQEDWREMLALIPVRPKNKDEDIRAVAQALKTNGADFESLFVEFAKKHGIRSHRAKWIWNKEKPESDAFEELLEQYEAAKKQKQRFSPLSAAIIEAMPPQPWRVKDVLPAFGLAAFYGASTAGKSFAALEMAAAIAEGMPFFGHATKPAPVLIVGLEGESGYRGRVLAWQRHHGRAMPDNVAFLLQPFRLTDPQDVADLAAICPPGCVVFIDTLNRAAPGMDENSSRDMGAVIEGAKTLQRLIGGLVVLVAHTGKDTAKGLRGHSSLFAALDAAVLVSREGDARSWKVDKAKDGRDGDVHYFRLHVVEIETDEDGDVVTSCVVVPDSVMPTRAEKPLTANQKMALESFRAAAGTFGGLDEQGNFNGLHLSQWRPVFYRMSPADSDAAKKKAFERARKDLIELQRIEVENNVYRLAGDTAPIEEKCIAEVLKAARDKATGQRQTGDMSRVASLPLGDDSDTLPLGSVACPADAIADFSNANSRPMWAPNFKR